MIWKSIWKQESRCTVSVSGGGIYCCFSQNPVSTNSPWIIFLLPFLRHSSFCLDFFFSFFFVSGKTWHKVFVVYWLSKFRVWHYTQFPNVIWEKFQYLNIIFIEIEWSLPVHVSLWHRAAKSQIMLKRTRRQDTRTKHRYWFTVLLSGRKAKNHLSLIFGFEAEWKGEKMLYIQTIVGCLFCVCLKLSRASGKNKPTFKLPPIFAIAKNNHIWIQMYCFTIHWRGRMQLGGGKKLILSLCDYSGFS